MRFESDIQRLARRLGAHTDDWSPHEQEWLTLLAHFSGIPERRWPTYPRIANSKLDEIQRRVPAYRLWTPLQKLCEYYEQGLYFVHNERLAPWCESNDPKGQAIPAYLIQAWRQEYAELPAARDLLRHALEPVTRDTVGEIPVKRGAMAWHSLPTELAGLKIGFAKQWASAWLCKRIYSPYRPQWENVPLALPPFPPRQYYDRGY